MKYSSLVILGVSVAVSSALASCGTNSSSTSADISETAQQVGDTMASVDESGGSGGSLAELEASHKFFARVSPQDLHDSWFVEWANSFAAPAAYAAGCGAGLTFGSCTSNTLTRTFGGCTIGAATFDGTVLLTWGGASTNCHLQAIGDTVARAPSFTVTGRRGATLSSTKIGTVGQKLTWTSGSGVSKVFAFTNDGIRRVFTSSAGTATLDYTTQATTPLTITGTLRSNRVINGGTLRVTNNLTAVTCDYTPTNVVASATCNCAVSGSWDGTCSDGKTTTLTLTGCGTGSFTQGSDSETVTFDRCYGI